MIARSFDEPDGIIVVESSGAWSAAEVDAHFSALGTIIGKLRAAGRSIKILSDITLADRQDPAIEQRIRAYQQRLYQPGDRIALLVQATDKPHVIGLLGHADVATFNSRLAAEMWLVNADLKKPA